MHELSIAVNLVEIATERIERLALGPVEAVHLRLGRLSGVVPDALLFSFDVATQGSALEGARLVIQTMPIVVRCPRCDAERELPGMRLRCPTCGASTPQVFAVETSSCSRWRYVPMCETGYRRLVEVREGVLQKNDQLAHELRHRFLDARVYVVNMVSSPGAGKTALLERTLAELKTNYRVAALVGDLATDNDARRLARSGARSSRSPPDGCHLEADMVARPWKTGICRARLPVHRERRQPGLPVHLRPRRGSAPGAVLGDRG